MASIKKTDHARMRIKQIIPDVYTDAGLSPSDFIKKYWNIYLKTFPRAASIDGEVFEKMIAITLTREGIIPFFMQAKAAFVNNAIYDFIIYTEKFGPVSLSAKINLKERWKQADLEALALKHIFRSSESFVITMNSQETKERQAMMKDCMAINDFILGDQPGFDALLVNLKSQKLFKLDLPPEN